MGHRAKHLRRNWIPARIEKSEERTKPTSRVSASKGSGDAGRGFSGDLVLLDELRNPEKKHKRYVPPVVRFLREAIR